MQTPRSTAPSSNYYYRPTPQAQPVRSRRKRKFLPVLFLVVALGLLYHFVGLPWSPRHSNYTGSKKVTAANIMPPGLSQTSSDAMAAKINAVIAAHPELDIGVAVQDLNSGKIYQYGENQPFIAASISKVLTAVLFLHQVENGKASLTDMVGGSTAKYQLQQLIEQSDNTAWTEFNSLLGHQELGDYAKQIGLNSYDPDQNTLTADTIAILFGKLYNKQLLNNSDTALLLSYMQNANETDYIPASIPSGVKVYHKAGWLEDRVHDGAIIDNGKHPYVLVILSKTNSGVYDTMAGKQAFAAITSATTKAFL